jgi:hypothetical protein
LSVTARAVPMLPADGRVQLCWPVRSAGPAHTTTISHVGTKASMMRDCACTSPSGLDLHSKTLYAHTSPATINMAHSRPQARTGSRLTHMHSVSTIEQRRWPSHMQGAKLLYSELLTPPAAPIGHLWRYLPYHQAPTILILIEAVSWSMESGSCCRLLQARRSRLRRAASWPMLSGRC